MSDKLTEIMAWKRREIAPQLRPVAESELARLDASFALAGRIEDEVQTVFKALR
jgi:indole-3-glycerol phosphate synthase